jgi:membrane-associated phospholipid phosphatase
MAWLANRRGRRCFVPWRLVSPSAWILGSLARVLHSPHRTVQGGSRLCCAAVSVLEPQQALRSRLDRALLIALRTRGHARPFERFAQTLGAFGEYGIGWAALSLTGAALSSGRRRRFAVAASAAPAAVGVNYLVKMAVGRSRPVIEGYPPLGPASNKLSFPSAHSTSAVTAATVLGRISPRARAPLYVLAALICLGRPYLGMHYPSDVLAGVALGYGLGRIYPLPPEVTS